MEVTGLGTAIMLAVAAGLWFLYLVPTWLKRREYLETERTATRLQQTIRVMAETAETPEVLRVEATARAAAQQERAVRAEDRRRIAEDRAAAERQVRAARAAEAAASVAARSRMDAADARRRRVRRGRVLASLLMIAATAVGVIQVVLIATTGAVTASWVVLAVAAAGGCVAVGCQRRLDRMRTAPSVAHPVAATAPAVSADPAPVASAPADRAWTPTPLPRPRYLERPAAVPVAPRVDAAALLRAAAEEGERARRAAHAEPEVVPFRRSAGVPAASRFARMGVLDAADTAATDLDEVLRRRRSAG